MQPYWAIHLSHIRELVSELVHEFPWNGSRTDSKAREQELERLADVVLNYGRLKSQFYQDEITTVDVTELAFRFRETTRAIIRTLKLLEKHRLAERTNVPQLWILHVTELDRQPRDGRPIDLQTG